MAEVDPNVLASLRAKAEWTDIELGMLWMDVHPTGLDSVLQQLAVAMDLGLGDGRRGNEWLDTLDRGQRRVEKEILEGRLTAQQVKRLEEGRWVTHWQIRTGDIRGWMSQARGRLTFPHFMESVFSPPPKLSSEDFAAMLEALKASVVKQNDSALQSKPPSPTQLPSPTQSPAHASHAEPASATSLPKIAAPPAAPAPLPDDPPDADVVLEAEQQIQQLRAPQRDRLLARQLAERIWEKEPTLTIREVAEHELIAGALGGAYTPKTVQAWISAHDPRPPGKRRGRPRKRG